MTGAGAAPYVVVYDGECGVCTRMVNVIRDRDRDGRFELVPHQAPGVMARFPAIPRADFEAAVQLIGPEGERWDGAGAVERILELLPRARLLAWLFRLPLARPMARRVYRWFARHRHRFGCGDHCPPA